MSDIGHSAGTWVIQASRVRESINALLAVDTHQFFPAYLHLRRQAHLKGQRTGLHPDWAELGSLMRVPGGPDGKPHLRPFWKGNRDSHQEWLGKNLAGSYAPSSLRGVPNTVVETNADGQYSLKDEHWSLASENLLDGARLPALALAGFFFRDYGIQSSSTPTAGNLITIFRDYFGYGPSDDVEFAALYDDEWRGAPGDWTEPFDSAEDDA